ncbi:MAG: N-acetylglucosamine-6-phosphate deacetylase [Lactobacillus sp.]|nr:N-acetylglucosamine-6-phosphate deacetylase [Lactobacillus sp.]
MTYLIHASQYLLKTGLKTGGYLEIVDGKFGNYFPGNNHPDLEVVELGNTIVGPGLVDTHIHGMLKEDVMKSDWTGINKISEGLLKAGVTTWLPTTVTASSDQLTDICHMFSEHKGQETGAKIAGIHFEGPFFTEEHAGAENPKYMIDPNMKDLNRWLEASDGMLKKMSMAPERAGSCNFIRQATDAGVIISIGHSSADYDTACAAIQSGATIFTHTFNGMPEADHHNPSIANAALSVDGIYRELICDGHHVHPSLVKALIKASGEDHIVLITDCMEAGMMPDGDYILGELSVYVKDGMARLKQGDNLAGSVLLLKDAVKNLVSWGIPLASAMKMASVVPAESIGLDVSITRGNTADFIVMNQAGELQATYLAGKKRY